MRGWVFGKGLSEERRGGGVDFWVLELFCFSVFLFWWFMSVCLLSLHSVNQLYKKKTTAGKLNKLYPNVKSFILQYMLLSLSLSRIKRYFGNTLTQLGCERSKLPKEIFVGS